MYVFTINAEIQEKQQARLQQKSNIENGISKHDCKKTLKL